MENWGKRAVLALACLIILAGCGGPKYDASVFLMPKTGIATEVSNELQSQLQSYLGEEMTVGLVTSPINNEQKLLVEVISASHAVLIVPKQSLLNYTRQGGPINLDEWFDPAEYEEGVVEGRLLEQDEKGKVIGESVETRLFAIPMDKTKLFREMGFKGTELFAFIPANAPDKGRAVEVLKAMTE